MSALHTAPVGRVVFIGAVHEARPALAALLSCDQVTVAAVVTPPEDQAGRLSGLTDLASLADAAGVPVLRSGDVNAPAMVATIRGLEPDLLVVVGWTRLIGKALLAVPRRGCVGFHASLLPRHRGRAPVNWAILRGETLTGDTMMLLDPGVDTGSIVDQRSVVIGPEDTCGTVYERIADTGAEMLVEHLPALLDGTAPRRRQDPGQGDSLPRRIPEMGVLDWNRTARQVHDWVRALTTPYPGAFTDLDGRQLMIWRTLVPTDTRPCGPAGSVLAIEPAGLRVAANSGSVVVTSMSAPGEAPQPAAPWSRRAGISPGARFAAVPPEVARWARGEGPRPEVVAA
jgi:methionyl-tRNA formyltransferase